jgi:hypothetical protein
VIASIGPGRVAGGRRLKEVLLKHRADDSWRGELQALRDGLVGEERDWRA